ncbi:hypothetical protein [Actinacidiphila bryophytorum]|uniref:hypothetical protein n=1 Tax=Actinacidiphila bryophytorum TaxID=1436133 RepID=UPI001960D213|nr:hypothetical protein [Actinacidiphila bryophytorum]MBM9438293.1 hypothetical protein [Actinacidiphila bryophytorum]MBN6545744.1 hypothetical protein [Actinacidiphila bryophytorum]
MPPDVVVPPDGTRVKSSTFTQLPAFALEDSPTWIVPLVTVMPGTLTCFQLPIAWLTEASISLPPKFLSKDVRRILPALLLTQADSV